MAIVSLQYRAYKICAIYRWQAFVLHMPHSFALVLLDSLDRIPVTGIMHILKGDFKTHKTAAIRPITKHCHPLIVKFIA